PPQPASRRRQDNAEKDPRLALARPQDADDLGVPRHRRADPVHDCLGRPQIGNAVLAWVSLAITASSRASLSRGRVVLTVASAETNASTMSGGSPRSTALLTRQTNSASVGSGPNVVRTG